MWIGAGISRATDREQPKLSPTQIDVWNAASLLHQQECAAARLRPF